MEYDLSNELRKSNDTDDYLQKLKKHLRELGGVMSVGCDKIYENKNEERKLDDFYSEFFGEFKELENISTKLVRIIHKYQDRIWTDEMTNP